MKRVFAPEYLIGHGRGKAVVVSESGSVEAIADSCDHPDAIQLTRRIMLPGLVNAHSHAFQRVIRGVAEERAGDGNFWSWRSVMYRAANRLNPDDLYRVARMAFLEMALSGITTVGEFHYLHRDPSGEPYADPNRISKLMIKAAREVGIRICLLRVAYERAGFNKPADPLQRRFIEPQGEFLQNATALKQEFDGAYAWAGVAPHSIRAVSLPYLREVSAWALANDAPIHMHVSEQPKELEECLAEHGVTPVELLARERILSPRFTAVHGIHLNQSEIEALGGNTSFLCACPTTERNLGDGIVPADQLLRAGVRIALGSDSQAQIDLLEDARQLEYHLRLEQLRRGLIGSADLFRCATQSGAESLGVPADAADFFTLDLDDLSIAGIPEDRISAGCMFGAAKSAVRDVIVGGKMIVKDGQHPLHEEIVTEYLGVDLGPRDLAVNRRRTQPLASPSPQRDPHCG